MFAYLDYNATTPADRRVVGELLPWFSDRFGNPASRDHAYGWDAAEVVEDAREHVAQLINARGAEIVFTGGTTEAANCVLRGVDGSPAPPGQPGFVTWSGEHECILEVCHRLAAQGTVQLDLFAIDPLARVDLNDLSRRMIRREARLVALMAANNETGNVYPLREAARIAHDVGALFFTDATQAVGKMPIDVRELGIDFMAFSAHKMYGPKGVGALYIRSGEPKIELEPLIVGGGQERGLRAGTLNVPGIVGFGEACRIAKEEMAEEAVRVAAMRDRLEREILAALPDVSINGEVENRLPNTSNLCFHGVDARTMIRDMHDIAVSTHSACSSGNRGPSHVLKAMGLSDDDAYSSIRFSLGRFTTEEEIDYAIDKVITSVRKLRSRHTAGD